MKQKHLHKKYETIPSIWPKNYQLLPFQRYELQSLKSPILFNYWFLLSKRNFSGVLMLVLGFYVAFLLLFF